MSGKLGDLFFLLCMNMKNAFSSGHAAAGALSNLKNAQPDLVLTGKSGSLLLKKYEKSSWKANSRSKDMLEI